MDTDGMKRAPGRPVDASLGPVIVDAVLDVLSENGYAGLTTAAVARRAGVSTATIYRRWASKRELILATARHLADDGIDEVDTGSLHEDVRALLGDKQRILSGRVSQALLILCGESTHDPELSGILRTSILEPTRRHLQTMFDRAAARGEPRPILEAATASRIVLGAVLAGATFDATSATGASLSDADVAALLRILTIADGTIEHTDHG